MLVQSAVYDYSNALDGEGRLRHRRCQHHFSFSGRTGGDGRLLFCIGKHAVERADVRGAEGLSQELLAAADFGFSGEEGQDVPCLGFVCFPNVVSHQFGDVFWRGFFCGMPDFYRKHAAFAFNDRSLQGCGECLRVNGGRHDNDAKVFP